MLTRAAAFALAVAALMSGCTPAAPAAVGPTAPAVPPASSLPPGDERAAPAETRPPRHGELTFAVVGDSLSLGNSPDFEAGVAGDLSWVFWAEDEATTFVGGTAIVGATSWSQADRAFPVDADALVLALGTNDLSVGAPFAVTADALVEIAATVGAPRVLVLAVPPRRHEGEPTTVEFNAWLQGLAAEHDWEFVDAASTVRAGAAWAAGMSGDGIHYTREAVPLVGAYVGAALRGELG